MAVYKDWVRGVANARYSECFLVKYRRAHFQGAQVHGETYSLSMYVVGKVFNQLNLSDYFI